VKKRRTKKLMSIQIMLRFEREDAEDLDRIMDRVRQSLQTNVAALARDFGGWWLPGKGYVQLKRDALFGDDVPHPESGASSFPPPLSAKEVRALGRPCDPREKRPRQSQPREKRPRQSQPRERNPRGHRTSSSRRSEVR
jgi:hypothetical protein